MQIVYDETCINENHIGIQTFLDLVVVGLTEVHVLQLIPWLNEYIVLSKVFTVHLMWSC